MVVTETMSSHRSIYVCALLCVFPISSKQYSPATEGCYKKKLTVYIWTLNHSSVSILSVLDIVLAEYKTKPGYLMSSYNLYKDHVVMNLTKLVGFLVVAMTRFLYSWYKRVNVIDATKGTEVNHNTIIYDYKLHSSKRSSFITMVLT